MDIVRTLRNGMQIGTRVFVPDTRFTCISCIKMFFGLLFASEVFWGWRGGENTKFVEQLNSTFIFPVRTYNNCRCPILKPLKNREKFRVNC